MRTFFLFYVVPCNALMSLLSINRGPQKILLYFWGKGANKQKSEHCRPPTMRFQQHSLRRISRKVILFFFGTLRGHLRH